MLEDQVENIDVGDVNFLNITVTGFIFQGFL